MATRGQLTPKIQLTAEHHLGRQICCDELRLMAYVDYVMKNDQRLDPQKMNSTDRSIMTKWREAGYCEGGASGLSITREFFDIMQDILWLGYVAYREEEV